jgi:hypothetical protein
MNAFIYPLAVVIVIVGLAFFLKGILKILFQKLKSIQFKVDFSNKNKSD